MTVLGFGGAVGGWGSLAEGWVWGVGGVLGRNVEGLRRGFGEER